MLVLGRDRVVLAGLGQRVACQDTRQLDGQRDGHDDEPGLVMLGPRVSNDQRGRGGDGPRCPVGRHA